MNYGMTEVLGMSAKSERLTREKRRPRWNLVLGLLLVAGTFTARGEPTAVTVIPSPAGPGSATPHLAVGPDDDTVVLSWLEPAGDDAALRYSIFADGQWSPAQTAAQGGNWFVNWADFPSVTPISSDVWAAHWLVKRPGGPYAYDVAIALSADRGRTWKAPITPHADNTPTEHGFVSLYSWKDAVGAVWLDGRNMSEGGHGTHAGGMTLRSALVTTANEVTTSQLVDELVCDCCQTDVAVSAGGPIAVYRNRTKSEIRDIYAARHVEGRWEPGIPVARDDWKIDGCPVNGPAIAASGSGVAVAWFTAAGNAPRVRMARSADGGATFSEAIDLDSEHGLGRVDIELIRNEIAVVSWLRRSAGGQGEAVARSVLRDGNMGPIQVIGETSAARASGFPQMVHYGEHLLFAWTDTSKKDTFVNTAIVPITAFE